MIVIDSAEKPYVFSTFKRLNIPHKKETISILNDCGLVPYISGIGQRCSENRHDGAVVDYSQCGSCSKYTFTRVGDFTNPTKSFIIERKRVDDAYSSLTDGRFYSQCRKMYSYCTGLKAIILEGMGNLEYFQDAASPFYNFDKTSLDFRTKSPLQQLVAMHPDKKKWIYSMIEDAASCGVVILQTWDIEETALMVNQINKGIDQSPKIRAKPIKIPGLSLEEKILTCFPKIGKGRAQNIIGEFGSLSNLINEIRKNNNEDFHKYKIYEKLREVFK